MTITNEEMMAELGHIADKLDALGKQAERLSQLASDLHLAMVGPSRFTKKLEGDAAPSSETRASQ